MIEYDLKKVVRLEKREDGEVIYNISEILRIPDALGYCIDSMSDLYRDKKLDAVACCYNRGVVFATPFAYRMHLPLFLVRSSGIVDSNYSYDMAVNLESLKPNSRILIVDDLIATGSTFKETRDLLVDRGCLVVGMFAVIGLSYKDYKKDLPENDINTLINY
ncbi:MAG: phosphoribosyltransferase family protein [Sphaerochaetaceae bacterium]